jgi:hypothetical protein
MEQPPPAGIARTAIVLSNGVTVPVGHVVHRNSPSPAWFDWLLKYNFIYPADIVGRPLKPAPAPHAPPAAPKAESAARKHSRPRKPRTAAA